MPLREGLALAFGRAIGDATAAVQLADTDPVEAVHAFRMSVRRARAFLRVVRPVAGAAWYADVEGELRRAIRATSALRDSEVMLDTLTRLPREARRAAVGVRRSLLTAAAAARDSQHASRRLSEAAAGIARLPDAFGAGLPGAFRWADLEGGIAAIYRRARRLRRRAAETRAHADIHAWRKRVKELRCALELIEGRSARARKLQAELGPLAASLGRVTDLLLLRGFVGSAAGGLDRRSRKAIVSAIDEEVSRRLAKQLRRSRRFFRVKPRRLARRTVRALASARPPDYAAI